MEIRWGGGGGHGGVLLRTEIRVWGWKLGGDCTQNEVSMVVSLRTRDVNQAVLAPFVDSIEAM